MRQRQAEASLNGIAFTEACARYDWTAYSSFLTDLPALSETFLGLMAFNADLIRFAAKASGMHPDAVIAQIRANNIQMRDDTT